MGTLGKDRRAPAIFTLVVILNHILCTTCQFEDKSTLPTALQGLTPCFVEGYLEDPLNCTRFYRCVDYGVPGSPLLLRHEFSCGPGTIFDRSLSVCNHPVRVKGSPSCYSAQYTYTGLVQFQSQPDTNSLVLEDDYKEELITSDSPRADRLVAARIGTTPTRRWPVKYVKAAGPVIHYQVQVPYVTPD